MGKKYDRRIGIFGGTFDPIHHGHLITAQYAAEELGLAKVIFLPAGRPPHKCCRRISLPGPRYEMVKIGIAGNKIFSASAIELSSDGASYTVESLRKIRRSYPGAELCLLMGLDQALSLSTWKDPEEIFKISKVVVMVRPGYQPADIENKWKERITLLPVPLIEISASDIRGRVWRGASIEYLVPNKIKQYIRRHGLYRNGRGR